MFSAPVSPLFKSVSFNVDGGMSIADEAPTMIAMHPHGIFCGAVASSSGVLHPGLAMRRFRIFIAPVLYHMPIFRLLMVAWLDCFASAGRMSMQAQMERKTNIIILPGGACVRRLNPTCVT